MLRAYKTEVDPTKEQVNKINQSIGICRFLYNHYLHYSYEKYIETKKGISGYEFDKYVNNELSQEYPWIKNCGSKARKQSILNAEQARKRYLSGISGKPQFKKKRKQDTSPYTNPL